MAEIGTLLQESGWSLTAEGSDTRPYVNLERDPVRVSVNTSRRHQGDVAVEVVYPCQPVGQAAYDDDPVRQQHTIIETAPSGAAVAGRER